MSAVPQVLVAEDDGDLREALADTLRYAGYGVTAVGDGAAALAALESAATPALLLTDVQMPRLDGQALLGRVRERWPQLPVVVVTAHGSIERAVAAMREGAADYLVKPFEADALLERVRRLARTPEPAGAAVDPDGPVAVDPRSRALLELARRVAATDVTVLVTGESGTGKEVYARYLHAASARRTGPFVAINCAAIPENMLEAVLFGHEKGAFTGAAAAHAGKFEQAQGGTLLLDEISEMSLPLQAKLLRVLQEREVERLGGTRTIALDVRVVATSNRELPLEVAAGRFREDLWYRLNVMPLRLPALRERPLDVVPLAERLLARRARGGEAPHVLAAAAAERLKGHDWPGNVRELDNVVQRAVVLANGSVIEPQDLVFERSSAAIAGGAASVAGTGRATTPIGAVAAGTANLGLGANGAGVGADSGGPADRIGGYGSVDGDANATPAAGDECVPAGALGARLRDRERDLIRAALAASGGSRKRAAERLGISPRTLRYKLAQLRAAGVDLVRTAADPAALEDGR